MNWTGRQFLGGWDFSIVGTCRAEVPDGKKKVCAGAASYFVC